MQAITDFLTGLKPWSRGPVVQFRQTKNQYTNEMMAMSLANHKRAVKRGRRHHAFFFLDLPQDIRILIYKILFSNTVTVCSFNKDHTDTTFAKSERCQILMTCRAILEEAEPYLYSGTTFKFTSQNKLDYFLWHDVDPNKHELVQQIILTQRELVLVFPDYLKFFVGLRRLIVDFPRKIRRQAALQPDGHRALAKFIRQLQWFRNWIAAYLPEPNERTFSVAVVVQLLWTDNEDEKSEMCLVDVDRLRVQQNYRPVPLVEKLEYLHMPSSGDSDVEIQELRAKRYQTVEAQV